LFERKSKPHSFFLTSQWIVSCDRVLSICSNFKTTVIWRVPFFF
jgi:hypothetical protein